MADPVNQVVRFADKALRFCYEKEPHAERAPDPR
jgi:hypothetical protein